MKRLLALAGLLAVAAASLVFYRGTSLIAAAKNETDPRAKIAILERSEIMLPLDAERLHALGQAHLEAGASRLSETAGRDAHFQSALEALRHSLTLNPLSAIVHFDLGQAYEYIQLLDLPVPGRPLDEYLQAARLAGRDIDMFDKTGRALFSKWASLRFEDKRFTLNLLKSSLANGQTDRVEAVLNIWAVHVQDAGVLRSILPPAPSVYREYADFLARRSLDRAERISAMVLAEGLEFKQARDAAAAGRAELQSLKVREAEDHFRTGLRILDGIRFYQSLQGKSTIDAAEVANLRRALRFGLARCRIETAPSLDEAWDDLFGYLEIEDSSHAVADLEKNLRERGLIEGKTGSVSGGLRRLLLELTLSFKQNRFREITEAGQALEKGLLLVPDPERRNYAAMLEIIGDAYQKLDYLYESDSYYQKALTTGMAGMGLFPKMRKNFERLNDGPGMKKLDVEVLKLLPGNDITLTGVVVPKGTAFTQTLLLEGGETRLVIRTDFNENSPHPYVGVFLNGRVVWEDFLGDRMVELTIVAQPGVNKLEIQPWNAPLALAGLKIGDITPVAVIVSPAKKGEAVPPQKGLEPAGRKTVPALLDKVDVVYYH